MGGWRWEKGDGRKTLEGRKTVGESKKNDLRVREDLHESGVGWEGKFMFEEKSEETSWRLSWTVILKRHEGTYIGTCVMLKEEGKVKKQ